MSKMKISVKYAEKFLIFDLLLSNGFKIQNIPIRACHVVLSIGMDIYPCQQIILHDMQELVCSVF